MGWPRHQAWAPWCSAPAGLLLQEAPEARRAHGDSTWALWRAPPRRLRTQPDPHPPTVDEDTSEDRRGWAPGSVLPNEAKRERLGPWKEEHSGGDKQEGRGPGPACDGLVTHSGKSGFQSQVPDNQEAGTSRGGLAPRLPAPEDTEDAVGWARLPGPPPTEPALRHWGWEAKQGPALVQSRGPPWPWESP